MKSHFYSNLPTNKQQTKQEFLEEFLSNLTESEVQELSNFIQQFGSIQEGINKLDKDIKKLNEVLSHPKVKKALNEAIINEEGMLSNVLGGLTGGIGKILGSIIPNLDEIKNFINTGAKIMPMLSLLMKGIEWLAPKLGFGGGNDNQKTAANGGNAPIPPAPAPAT